MSSASRYSAPFAPTSADRIDPETARKLLSVALAQGGDYADLFFEYRAAGSYVARRGHPEVASVAR